MTLRSYLVIMSLMTIVSWASFVFILFMVDPYNTNWVGFVLFYLTLFFSLTGTTALVGFLIRFILLKRILVFHSVIEAFRQSFLFSLMIVFCLFLLSKNMLTLTNIILLIIFLSLVEYFLISISNKRNIKTLHNNFYS